MKSLTYIVLTVFGLFLAVQTAWASKAYIADSCMISLRRGPSIENLILKYLAVGQPVEVIETQGEWSQVQLFDPNNNKLSGWVKSFYLTTRIPWEDQAKALKQENDKLKQKLASAQMENKESVGREQELNAELAQLEKSIKKSEDEYRSLKLESTDYLRLKSEHDSTLKNLDMLTRKNEKLTTSQRNIFFGMGGAVVLCGFVLGLIIGKQDKRRKSYY
jgi:SH3 domain protein